MWVSPSRTFGAENPTKEENKYKLEAACLFNFLHFIDWPQNAFAAPNSPFCIGVVGENPFDGILEQIVAGESIDGRTIEVRQITKVEDAKRCNIIFFPETQRDRCSAFLDALGGTTVITVSEFDQFTSLGGGINFYLENDKLRFEINVAAMQASQVQVSSKLLRLARVYTKQGKEN
ncbi:MAG TPA: YfiR family protein [Bacteroidota bacterium]|nr:YfiR family protein [Bacteroidota bacterium]